MPSADSGATPLDPTPYYQAPDFIRFLDIDLPSADGDWRVWVHTRPYFFIPEYNTRRLRLPEVDPKRLHSKANEFLDAVPTANYNGPILKETLILDQIRYACGLKRGDSGLLKPLRLDKALAALFALNHYANRFGQPLLLDNAITCSCFSIFKVGAEFKKIRDPARKAEIVKVAAGVVDQDDQLVSDAMGGMKTSLHVAVRLLDQLRREPEFSVLASMATTDAIEPPSRRHIQATGREDFARGRLESFPAPYRGPPR